MFLTFLLTKPTSAQDKVIPAKGLLDNYMIRAEKHSQRDIGLKLNGKDVGGYYKNHKGHTLTKVQDKVDTPYFDSNIYPHLIRFLPLKTDYQAVNPIYDFNL